MLRKFLPVLVTVLALGLSGLITVLVQDRHIEDRQMRLEAIRQRLQARIEDQVFLLGAIKGLILTEGALIDRRKLTTFLTGLPAGVAGSSAQGLGFALAIGTGADAVATRAARRSYPDAPAPWPDTAEAMRTPIVLLEPQDARNRQAISYDMYSEPLRRAAMDSARLRRGPALSRPLTLVQEMTTDIQPGVLLYVPVFADEGVAPPEGAGVGALVGYVYSPIRIGDLVASVLRETASGGVAVALSTAPGEPAFFTRGAAHGAQIIRLVQAADTTWVVTVSDNQSVNLITGPAGFVMVLGALASLLVGIIVRQHFRELDSIERIAAANAGKAESTAVLLGEMQHRIKNSIARKLAIFRLTVRETKDRKDLVEAFEARMQSFARAQDILINAPGGGIPVETLVREELGNWASASPSVRFSGPEVMLDGNQAQALALICHELTTNSLKYGALRDDRALDVLWQVEPAGHEALLTFLWREDTGPKSADAPGDGFGSRLIRLMAEGQLNGSWSRTHGENRLDVTVRFAVAPPSRQSRV